MWDQSSVPPEHNQRSAPARLPHHNAFESHTLELYPHNLVFIIQCGLTRYWNAIWACFVIGKPQFYVFVCLFVVMKSHRRGWRMPKKKKKNCETLEKGFVISTLPSHNHQGLIVMRFPLVKQQLWLVTETAFHGTNMLAAHSPSLSTLSMPRESIWRTSLANSTGASKMIKC